MTIGVLAVQGAFIEHEQMLQNLVPPAMQKPLQEKIILQELPILATCAGLILLAQDIGPSESPHLATLPVSVKRNAYGRQLSSFMTTKPVTDIGDYPMVFIRAPYVESVDKDVEINLKDTKRVCRPHTLFVSFILIYMRDHARLFFICFLLIIFIKTFAGCHAFFPYFCHFLSSKLFCYNLSAYISNRHSRLNLKTLLIRLDCTFFNTWAYYTQFAFILQ